VRLERPTGYFLQLLAEAPLMPVPGHLVEAVGDTWGEPEHIITCGAFRLLRWESEGTCELGRDPSYHRRHRGNVDRILFANYAPSELDVAYENDELDVALLIQVVPEELDRIRRRHAGDCFSTPAPGTIFTVINAARHPFDDSRVRRAFAKAIDNSRLANVVFRGQYAPATGGLVPPGMPAHSPGIGLPFNPVSARQELADAGYPGGGGFPVVHITTSDTPSVASWVQHVRSSLHESLGITTTWTRVPGVALHKELYEHTPDIWMEYWMADYSDPENFLGDTPWRHLGGWHHSEYERLVRGARHTIDPDARLSLYRRADRILAGEAAVVPNLYGRSHLLVKPWVRNPPLAGPPRFKDVVILPH
jgi:ABC-type oligopeptide transport system substrate-binding subunit